jgi:predicted O-methyltransferase YrrM
VVSKRDNDGQLLKRKLLSFETVDYSYCPVLDEMMRSRRATGQSGRVFEGLGALSTANNLEVLRNFMMERRPVRSLEVGLSFGGSALTIAASHRDLGHAPNHQHTALDPYQTTTGESGWDSAGLVAIHQAGLAGFVDFRPQHSAIGLAQLVAEKAAFGLIYVDGSHLFDDVFVDAYFAFRLLDHDGVVMFDDSSIDHVAKVLSFVRANWAGWTEEVDLSAFRADGGKSLRYRVGGWFGRRQLRAFRRTGEDSRLWDAPLQPF